MKTKAIKREDIPVKLATDLIDYHFNPATWSDGFSMNAWRGHYGQAMIDACEKLVIEPYRKDRKAIEKLQADLFKKHTKGLKK